MELQFLGTSAGTPTNSRNVSGLALKKAHSKSWILVDCGEATQHQLLHTSLSLSRLTAICITHVHGDHCYGLPGLLASASLMGRTAPLIIIGPPELQTWLQVTFQLTQVTLSYELKFIDVASLTAPLTLPEFSVTPWPLSHRVPCFGYEFVETGMARRLNKAKLWADHIRSGPVWGQLQRGESVTLSDGRNICSDDYLLAARAPRKIIIAGDNDDPTLLSACAKSAQLLVHEATYTQEVADKVAGSAKPDPQHSSASLIGEFAQKMGLPNLILSHFSPRYQAFGCGLRVSQIEQEARKHYAGRLFLAEDLARYRLDALGRLSSAHTGSHAESNTDLSTGTSKRNVPGKIPI